VSRDWKPGLGNVDSCYAKRGRRLVHWVRVMPSTDGAYRPGVYALCGVKAGEPGHPSVTYGNECKACHRLHPVWGTA
jgi:hypothetical protein